MDNAILKKRLSTFRTDSGKLKNVSDDLLIDILRAWEQWPGSAKDFYSSLGSTHRQMAKLMGRAKKLHREGRFPESEFKEIRVESGGVSGVPAEPCQGIELSWESGKLIRFVRVDELVDFLKKVA